jgi:hypothetical protein
VAVTITDHRTVWNEADANTGWTGATTVFTTDPDPVEATGCLGIVVAIATSDAYHTGAATNLSNKLVWVWVYPRGANDTAAAGGLQMHIGDGTNRIGFHVAGSDVAAFRHDSGPVGWTCMLVDTSNLPGTITTRAGSLGALNLSAITQLGAVFKNLAMAPGGIANYFIDIMRFMDPTTNDGCAISVIGGTSGDPGRFSEIAAADRSTVNLGGLGIIREAGAGLFTVQGPLRFGNAAGSNSSWFVDTNVSVAFESRGLLTTRYRIVIVDNGVGTTTFRLGTKVGTGLDATGANGCNLIVPAGVGALFDSGSDTDVTDCFLYGCLLSGFTQGIVLGGGGQEFIDNIVAGSGAVTCLGPTVMVNTDIVGSTVAANASALVWNNAVDPDTYLAKMLFSKGAAAHHAIEFGTSSPTTMTLRDMTFTGFSASNNQNDSVLHIKRTTGTVTINLVNVTGIVSYRTDGATVVLVNAVSLTLTGLRNDGPLGGTEVRVFEAGTGNEIAGDELVVTGTFTTSIDAATYPLVDIAILTLGFLNIRLTNVNMAAGDVSIPIQQVVDRQYFNPP